VRILSFVRLVDGVLWCLFWASLIYIFWLYAKAISMRWKSFPTTELLCLSLEIIGAGMLAMYYLYLYIEHRLLYGGSIYLEFTYELIGALLGLVSIGMAWTIERTRRTPIILIGVVLMVSFCDLLGIIPYPESIYEFVLFLVIGVPLLIHIYRMGLVGHFDPSRLSKRQ
jgi:hypothetical protein